MENQNVISIKNLVKQFPVGGDYFTALQQVDLELAEGECIGLVGPSGSGKTTLLNIIVSINPKRKQYDIPSESLHKSLSNFGTGIQFMFIYNH